MRKRLLVIAAVVSLPVFSVHVVAGSTNSAAESATKYGDPKATYQTYLDAVMRNDLEAAKACWTISDGNKSGALDAIVGIWITTRKFSKMIHSNFKELEEEMVRNDCLDAAMNLTMKRVKDSSFEVTGDTAKLTIKWQKEDGYPNEAFCFSPDPIPFRKTGSMWKIDANSCAEFPADPSALMSAEGGLGDAMRKSLSVMDSVVRDFQAGKIKTAEQVRKAMREQQDTMSLPTELRLEDFKTIYYQTNEKRTKAYLFFSQPDYIVIGMSHSSKWDTEAEKIGVNFSAVRNAEGNRDRFDTARLMKATRTNDLWGVDLDIGVGTHGKPDDKFKMYYSTAKNPWAIELPFKGTTER